MAMPQAASAEIMRAPPGSAMTGRPERVSYATQRVASGAGYPTPKIARADGISLSAARRRCRAA
jgi:hypothetical protein